MKLEEVKKRLGVNSRQMREVRKACGFMDVKNWFPNHIKTMNDYIIKAGVIRAETKDCPKCEKCGNFKEDDGHCFDCDLRKDFKNKNCKECGSNEKLNHQGLCFDSESDLLEEQVPRMDMKVFKEVNNEILKDVFDEKTQEFNTVTETIKTKPKNVISKCVICKVNENYDDGLCKDCWEKYNDGKISSDEVWEEKQKRNKALKEDTIIGIDIAETGSDHMVDALAFGLQALKPVELKVKKGELLQILSKAYDVGFKAGKNDLKVSTPGDLNSILNEVINTKEKTYVTGI